MASFKTLVFVSLLVIAALAVVPIAKAQLGGLGGLTAGLLGLIRIQGTLFCTANGRVSNAGASLTPVFPNATVQLQCGSGNVVSTAITNTSGLFSIVLDPLQFLLSSLLSNCKLVVSTPLSSCNSSLSGTTILQSTLQLIGTTLAGLLSIINLIPAGFSPIIN
ncbi:phylloplanin-like [Rosa rugosa]|uniref:Putative immunoglobulin-like protein n=1 Tax=Rosa chinensis TaxID=74649 RepID=A0A2P6QYG3_ROSCH|nr:phylloplanin [Rosa chinensis]XP_061995088.1 phylloplanin-like [Rosa rugosa]PRQ39242.1 putative immunoglobulin-like protein [Rosa chinensis]